MCGIVAVHDPTGPDSALGERMLDRIGHRGPDGRGTRTVGPTWLGHARLSIVDLDHGAQPLPSDDGHWAVVNGEIYNHARLREVAPRDFRTDSDSEAALSAAISDDPDALGDLRGMYAFAVAHVDGDLVVARDPVGVKPLYWVRTGPATLFASEMRAFDAVHRPLVESFPPGHRWSPTTGLARFRELHVGGREIKDRDLALRLLRTTLETAVHRRMMADVPLGVFLSGGLDSSLVAALMARHADEVGGTVHSFAAGTAGSSDVVAARRVAEHLGLEHHERLYDADEVLAVLPDVVRSIESYEPSLVRSAVPNYLLAQETARTVKVVLTGEGADELFAGYSHHRDVAEADLRQELLDSVSGLHNLNLQRCDRVTMAHGLEARVPFLDRDVVDLAARLPISWRVPHRHGLEKALLREAFAGWLPDDVLWRPKEQFGEGSGTAEVMARRVADLVPDPDWAGERVAGLPAPRSREELAYQRMFAEGLAGVPAALLGRFADA
ncbi:asparagine synthase (glutamine-hydrolyzing) [Nocardioides donggukensis]|uniref:asparagine synthase (glutamine-hydrolyzing) n=1 Tax=Nocardioides donggukensis TaxID=2774019 RepID=A0A927K450_9ACTN|nr:asparagine synthase (glutamine-hydrolyzing) [Nocardioides donggukensis]MBD8870327.1 asparagine synthase (glutamine-hydrolyzing) [Nocardioides donggukensis]